MQSTWQDDSGEDNNSIYNSDKAIINCVPFIKSNRLVAKFKRKATISNQNIHGFQHGGIDSSYQYENKLYIVKI